MWSTFFPPFLTAPDHLRFWVDRHPVAEVYRKDIALKLDEAIARAGKDNVQFGALILEPVVQGAGGMMLIDPLYQRCLMQDCKRRRIPVILDEVRVEYKP